MALRAVFPRGHDQVKGNVFRALVPHEALDLQRQLPLGDPFPDVGEDMLESSVRNRLGLSLIHI